jgi:hypothetical protein
MSARANREFSIGSRAVTKGYDGTPFALQNWASRLKSGKVTEGNQWFRGNLLPGWRIIASRSSELWVTIAPCFGKVRRLPDLESFFPACESGHTL